VKRGNRAGFLHPANSHELIAISSKKALVRSYQQRSVAGRVKRGNRTGLTWVDPNEFVPIQAKNAVRGTDQESAVAGGVKCPNPTGIIRPVLPENHIRT
jgi:hypothetical protein